jgi:hypothetical protein
MSTSDTVTYPGSGPSCGGNTPTPALECMYDEWSYNGAP